MNNIFRLANTLRSASGSAQAMDKCQIKMENAAAFELAQPLTQSVLRAKVLWFEMGAWTEAVANNTGAAAWPASRSPTPPTAT